MIRCTRTNDVLGDGILIFRLLCLLVATVFIETEQYPTGEERDRHPYGCICRKD